LKKKINSSKVEEDSSGLLNLGYLEIGKAAVERESESRKSK